MSIQESILGRVLFCNLYPLVVAYICFQALDKRQVANVRKFIDAIEAFVFMYSHLTRGSNIISMKSRILMWCVVVHLGLVENEVQDFDSRVRNQESINCNEF